MKTYQIIITSLAIGCGSSATIIPTVEKDAASDSFSDVSLDATDAIADATFHDVNVRDTGKDVGKTDVSTGETSVSSQDGSSDVVIKDVSSSETLTDSSSKEATSSDTGSLTDATTSEAGHVLDASQDAFADSSFSDANQDALFDAGLDANDGSVIILNDAGVCQQAYSICVEQCGSHCEQNCLNTCQWHFEQCQCSP